MVTFRTEYGDLPTLSLAKVSSSVGSQLRSIMFLPLEKVCRPPNFQQVDHCRLLAMVKINTVDRAVKSLGRHDDKDHSDKLRIFSAG